MALQKKIRKPVNLILMLLFVGAALIYALSLRAYYVGFFNDDAFYVIGARSLAAGSYLELNQPGHPPLVNYMPGYPLLMVPLIWIFGESPFVLQLFSIFLTVITLGLIFRLFRREWDVKILLPFLLICAFNPLTVSLSGTVLSDVPFLLFTLVSLLYLSRIWDTKKVKPWILYALLTSLCFYIRPVGALLTVGTGIALLLEKRWKTASLVLLIPMAGNSLFLIRNNMVQGTGLIYLNEYFSHFGGESPSAPYGSWALQNAGYYLTHTFVHNLYRWPGFLKSSVSQYATIIICGGLSVYGLWLEGFKKWKKSLLIFLVLYSVLHLFWVKQSGRYLLPVYPFLIFYFYKGILGLEKYLPKRVKGRWIAVGLALLLFIAPLKRILETSLFLKTPLNTPPENTIQWVL